MSKPHPVDSEWGYLMKLQADRIKQEEMEMKKEEELRKRQYKYIRIKEENSSKRWLHLATAETDQTGKRT